MPSKKMPIEMKEFKDISWKAINFRCSNGENSAEDLAELRIFLLRLHQLCLALCTNR